MRTAKRWKRTKFETEEEEAASDGNRADGKPIRDEDC